MTRAHWASRLGFILAAAGSAIGLGNIWKFPYITGMNGGGAFVLIYLICIAVIGIPIFLAELFIGQKSQSNAVEAFEKVHKKGTFWTLPGWLGILSAFLILSFYSVVGGWVLDFEFKAITNQFAGHTDSEIKEFLGTLFASPKIQIFWHFMFMAGVVAIVAAGIKNGIEKWNKILMPALLGILGLLLFRSMFLEGFGDALAFLFEPDFQKITGAGILESVGHSFFTLSLGMGAMITYGGYLASKKDLIKTTVTIALLDTLIALIAGVVIFSIVFTYDLEPGGGPTLMFQTLPMLFSKMTGGYIIAVGFFMLVAFAAFTSAVSLLEVVVTYWLDKHQTSRLKAAGIAGGLAFLLGILSALSTNILSSEEYLIGKFTFFDLFDKLTSSVFLPFGGLLISLFFGWVLGPKAINAIFEKKSNAETYGVVLLWVTRIIAPLGVLVMLFNGLKDW